MKAYKKIKAIDLFCGAGGTSTGLAAACEALAIELDLVAINHWDVAIATHSQNFPSAKHYCQDLVSLKPREIVPGRKLDLMLASPECRFHSNALGGRPINDQSRASAWHVLHWCEAIQIDSVLIENVREFQNWGPLGSNNQPIKRRKGETFYAFLKALESLGYRVDYQVLRAADYGDATTRERLFIQARRGRKPIVWPEPSHTARTDQSNLFGEKPRWRTAREIIDWSLPNQSIFDRKKPLANNTLKRILTGLTKFWGIPFTLGVGGPQGSSEPRSIDEPLRTIMPGGHLGLLESFLIPEQSIAAIKPFLFKFHENHKGKLDGFNRSHSLNEPLRTIDTSNRYGLVEPFIVKFNGNGSAVTINKPLDTITTRDRFGLVIPELGTLDIRFRMLQPHELAKATSFPAHYLFAGNREQQVKQIGNAVPVEIAKSLCMALLT